MTMLQLPVNGLALFAPDCSSWGLPARGTSKRSFINVFGNIFLAWVQDAGCMVSRILCLKNIFMMPAVLLPLHSTWIEFRPML